GAAPVERALLAGDATTGVCVMAVERTLDTGAVYAVREVPIGPRATAAELRTQLVAIGTDLLVSTLAGPLPEPVDQRGEITYAAKIDPAELELTWTDPAERLDRLVRVGDAWTMFRGRRLRVLASELCPAGGGSPGELVDVAGGVVGTGDGGLALVEVQPEGRSAMTWTAFANGAHPRAGERLG
ncbi:MAG: methionyl-tRNA formyltransferase, partial [Acidimicrobiia bacterium]|nr:methionyl-tRNA formyltransferase [Acidimicrobiia bacterium]